MATYRVGIIGCGRPWRSEGASGFGMAHNHALGYAESPATQIVALADINEENARAFQAVHGGERIYTDYHEMLAREQLDIVSVCTWPRFHAEMVIAAAEVDVKAIHCEKPMAPTYGEAVRMVQACEQHGVQLTFNHQRRFGAPFRKAKELLQAGAVGELQRLEGTCANLFDWGTHWFDMFFFYNDETPAEWVIGQVDTRNGSTIFGVPMEGQGLSHFKFKNGVYGLLMTGHDSGGRAMNRLLGSDGMIEVQLNWQDRSSSPVRIWGKGQSAWQAVDVPLDENLGEVTKRGVLDLIDALQTGREPELLGRRALQATELIFATYESSRSRGRVDLPLQVEDSPLLALMQEQTQLS